MNKKIISGLAVSSLLLPLAAFAQDVGQIGSIDELFDKIRIAGFTVLSIVVFIAFLYAAILFLFAGGSAEKVASARTAFLWGIVGVVVGLLAWSILAIIQNLIGV